MNIIHTILDLRWFILVLGVLIFVHELGHFLMARRIGVRVLTFSLGFGPKLLSFRRGDTEYCVSAIPLGGYVKMAGENPEDARTGASDEFLSKSKWQRFQVLIMGPVMNLALALVVMAFVLYQGADVPAFTQQEVVVGSVEADSPAAEGGDPAGRPHHPGRQRAGRNVGRVRARDGHQGEPSGQADDHPRRQDHRSRSRADRGRQVRRGRNRRDPAAAAAGRRGAAGGAGARPPACAAATSSWRSMARSRSSMPASSRSSGRTRASRCTFEILRDGSTLHGSPSRPKKFGDVVRIGAQIRELEVRIIQPNLARGVQAERQRN